MSFSLQNREKTEHAQSKSHSMKLALNHNSPLNQQNIQKFVNRNSDSSALQTKRNTIHLVGLLVFSHSINLKYTTKINADKYTCRSLPQDTIRASITKHQHLFINLYSPSIWDRKTADSDQLNTRYFVYTSLRNS